MNAWSFYDPATGLFSKRVLHCSARAVEANTPSGLLVLEGEYDYLSQRVDLETGQVVDYQPPAPDDDHLWHHDAKRWRLKPEVAERRRSQAKARAKILELEASQLRPQRELMMDPENKEARQRLEAIEAAIAEQRGLLTLRARHVTEQF